jgi:acetate---CoA ligase (ADP-forming) subunit beta
MLIGSLRVNKTQKIFSQAKLEGRKALLEPEAKAICQENGISAPKFMLAQNQKEATSFADQIGYPIVAKIVSADIIHKSEAGGVVVNLRNASEVADAYQKIVQNALNYKPDAKIAGVLIQEMAPQGLEIIVGAIKDAQFGQTIMFGLGGIFVELLKDVSFKIAPVTVEEAKEMITQVKAYPLLKGFRGSQPVDIDAIVEIIMNTSKLIMAYPQIKELDFNPIMAYPKGAKVVDARIILE